MMGEEHQLGPGEVISMGVPEKEFNAVCGGCHGSVTGSELDVSVTADALTGASQSLSANKIPAAVGN
jgi:mono/diheme cytochrome c family protein